MDSSMASTSGFLPAMNFWLCAWCHDELCSEGGTRVVRV